MARSEGQANYADLLNRRSFLKLSGLLGLSLSGAGIYPGFAEAVKFNKKLYKVSQSRPAMGTFVSFTLVHPSRDQAEKAIGKAFEEINRLTRLMNRFDSGSALGQLNKEGFLKAVPPEISLVLAESFKYFRQTKGTFDISVKPVIDLFQKSREDKKFTSPSEGVLEQTLKLVDSDNISFNGRDIQFNKPGMGITLDGIAKGFIVDQAAKAVSNMGIENFLINAGGDIRLQGTRKDKQAWTVAIEDPSKKKMYPAVIRLTKGAVATSGNYEIFFDNEKMFNHIIDPRTGLSPEAMSSVTVVSPTAMEADALSTSVFVMRAEAGIRFLDARPGCEGLIISGDNRLVSSTGWNRFSL